MTLAALQHVLRAARTLAEDRRFLVLDSASLLAWIPKLGRADGPLAATYDAALCPEPFDELAAVKLSVGRPKDMDLVRILVAEGRIDPTVVQARIDGLNLPVEALPWVLSNLANAIRP